MCAKTRLGFSLLSFLYLCSLFVLTGAPAAQARRQNPPRTPLPTDNALSVSVGVSATWQSAQNNAVRPMQLSAEVSNYTLSETPAIDNLDDHQIAFESVTPEANWAVFAPQNNQFVFKFDIADTQGRLGKIVVKDLLLGTVLGQISATADGTALTGSLTADWNTVYYQIEGIDKAGAPLFRLGATQGKFDSYVPFSISNGFTPFRPAFIPCAHYTSPDGMMGTEGDPYSIAGVITGTSGFSKGCGYKDKVNDSSTPDSIEPPADFFRYIKHKKALDTASDVLKSPTFRSGDPAATLTLVNLLAALTKEDMTRVLLNLDIAPYSDACGHWHPAFSGAATAVYIIPYTRKKGNGGLLGVLAQAMTQFLVPGAKVLSVLGIDALTQFLMSPNGAPYGYIQGEVQVVGDVYTVDAGESYKSARQRPILQDVTFTLAPDIAPPGGTGSGRIEMATPLTTPPPPPVAYASTLTFSSPGWTYTTQLSKGYRYKVSGNFVSPPGYQPLSQPVEFSLPGSNAVSIPCTLTVLLQLKIYTVSTSNPAGPMGINVQVKNAAGQLVGGGMSLIQGDGKYAISAVFLPPGTYTVTASQGGIGGKWDGSTTVMVQRGILQETTVTAIFTPPPHP